ncbi:MAG: PAS domain-containing protein [Oscillatoria princeps RMCB-10]|nr:PAS domain-containing protein [Oscillatoria princeps RMCB-10]
MTKLGGSDLLTCTLREVIIPAPLTVSANTPVTDVIAQMSQGRLASLRSSYFDSDSSITDISGASCVLVMEGQQLAGVFTERDVVRLAAGGMNLVGMEIARVMARDLIVLSYSEFRDIFTALNLFRRHRIRHLPVLDESGQILGIITPESIRACMQPTDLLKWRRVAEVMSAEVVQAPLTASLHNVAQLMAERGVSCVVIVSEKSTPTQNLLIPAGIITERDIVRFQALELNLKNTPAKDVMSAPLFCLGAENSLWSAQQEMQQKNVRRLLVTGTQGELLGIVTQTSLLRVLDPMEMYSVIETLQQSVCRLEAEKVERLQLQNSQLEQLVQQRTADLQRQLEHQRLFNSMRDRIRQSLNLDEILTATVTEVRQFLQADRVLVYQFDPNMDGTIVAESVAQGWRESLKNQIQDTCFRERKGADYLLGRKRAVADIHTAGLSDCHLQLLQGFQVKSYLVVPILMNQESQESPGVSPEFHLWGLLIAHQCSGPRQWLSSELDLLDQLSAQIAIALQQAQLFQQVQTCLVERVRVEETLRQSQEQFSSLVANIPGAVYRCLYCSRGRTVEFISQEIAEISGYPASDIILNYRRSISSIIHPEDRQMVERAIRKATARRQPYQIEYRIVRADGGTRWVSDKGKGIFREDGELIWSDGVMLDITHCVQVQEELQQLNQELENRVLERTLELANAVARLQREMAERELAQKEVLVVNERLQYLLACCPTVIYSCKAEGDLPATFISENITALLGYSAREFLEDSGFWANRIHPADAPRIFAELPSLFQRGFHTHEYRFLHVDGTYRCLRDDIKLVRDAAGNPLEIVGSITDITDRKRAEEALRESEARFRSLFEAAPDFIHVADMCGTIRQTNPAAIRQSGYSESELIGSRLNEFFTPESQKIAALAFPILLKTGTLRQEVEFIRKDRTIMIVDCSASVVRDERGQFAYIMVIQRDITDRKKTEKELRKSDQRFALAVEGVNDGIWDWDIETGQAYFSPRWKSMLGCSDSEIPNTYEAWTERIHPEDRERVIRAVSDYLDSCIPIYETEFRCLHKDGTYRWILARGSALRDTTGKAYRMAGSHTDITDRIQAQTEMRRLQAAVETAMDGIAILNQNCEYIYLNKAHVQLFGYDSAAELMGQTWKELYSPEEINRIEREVFPVFLQNGQWRGETTALRRDGSTFAQEVSLTLISGVGLVCVFRDITERVRALEAMRQQVERERLMARVAEHIRHSLNLEEILSTAVTEVRQFFQIDRALVYRFDPDWSGTVIVESVGSGWTKLQGRKILDACLAVETCILPYTRGRVQAVEDIYKSGLADCYIGLLEQFQVRANLVVPILQGEQLWGLFVAQHCAAERQWQPWEISWLQQLAAQLAIALQQSELYKQLQMELAERQQAESKIRASLQEKEVLLKEIHHRVKNNLQVISSLLKLQSRHTLDRKTLDMLKESQNRVRSMALIHEKLYQSSDLARIDFADYMQNLAKNLLYSYSIHASAVKVEVIVDKVSLNLDTAIPCGLLINELISNALKYAFPDGRQGKICIEFSELEGEQFLLTVRDSGIGFPADIDFRNTVSLGLRLACSLTEQLDGTIDMERNQGTVFRVKFSELKYKQRS